MAIKKGGGSSLVKYEDFSVEEAESLEKEAAATRGGGVMVKLGIGKTVVRPIPALKGSKLIRHAFVHYVDVPGVGRISINCPRLLAKKSCPVCAQENKLMSTGNDVDYKKSRKLTAKRRGYMNVLVRGREEDGARVLPFGPQIEEQLIEIRKDEDDGGNYVHPVNGFDLIIVRKGEKMNTEYTVKASSKRPTPLLKDASAMEELIESQHNLDRFLRVESLSKIEARLRGEEPGDDDEEEDERPRAKRASSTIDEEIEDAEVVEEDLDIDL